MITGLRGTTSTQETPGSVVGLLDAGEPDATPEPVPAKLVERYDYDPYGKTYIAHWDATAGLQRTPTAAAGCYAGPGDLRKVKPSPATSTVIASPGARSPAMIRWARGFSSCCWIRRLSGRAPKAGS